MEAKKGIWRQLFQSNLRATSTAGGEETGAEGEAVGVVVGAGTGGEFVGAGKGGELTRTEAGGARLPASKPLGMR